MLVHPTARESRRDRRPRTNRGDRIGNQAPRTIPCNNRSSVMSVLTSFWRSAVERFRATPRFASSGHTARYAGIRPDSRRGAQRFSVPPATRGRCAHIRRAIRRLPNRLRRRIPGRSADNVVDTSARSRTCSLMYSRSRSAASIHIRLRCCPYRYLMSAITRFSAISSQSSRRPCWWSKSAS